MWMMYNENKKSYKYTKGDTIKLIAPKLIEVLSLLNIAAFLWHWYLILPCNYDK